MGRGGAPHRKVSKWSGERARERERERKRGGPESENREASGWICWICWPTGTTGGPRFPHFQSPSTLAGCGCSPSAIPMGTSPFPPRITADETSRSIVPRMSPSLSRQTGWCPSSQSQLQLKRIMPPTPQNVKVKIRRGKRKQGKSKMIKKRKSSLLERQRAGCEFLCLLLPNSAFFLFLFSFSFCFFPF